MNHATWPTQWGHASIWFIVASKRGSGRSTIFSVDSFGDYVGDGATDVRYCTLGGVVKVNSPLQFYAVANEFICGRLALLLGLPVPPGAIVRDGPQAAYVALRFGKEGERPPRLIASRLVQDHPAVAAGIAAFDCWIGNTDRHSGNVAYTARVPPIIFDHDRALLGTDQGEGVRRLLSLQPRAVVQGCIPPALQSAAHFGLWADRIRAVRLDVIQGLCLEAQRDALIAADEALAAASFLDDRKHRIMDMIRSVKNAFPKITDWGLAL